MITLAMCLASLFSAWHLRAWFSYTAGAHPIGTALAFSFLPLLLSAVILTGSIKCTFPT